MYVELGLEMSSIVAEELLSLFLNYASVDINEIVYDQQAKRVAIPVSRKEVDFKVTLFGKRPTYRKDARKAILQINHVEEFRVHVEKELADDFNGIFTVLFGVKIDKNNIYLCTGEEIHGRTVVKLETRVSSLAVRIIDVSR